MRSELLKQAIDQITTAGRGAATRLWHSIDRPAVIAIKCPSCNRWVHPRAYNPRTHLCRRCRRPAAAYARYQHLRNGRRPVAYA